MVNFPSYLSFGLYYFPEKNETFLAILNASIYNYLRISPRGTQGQERVSTPAQGTAPHTGAPSQHHTTRGALQRPHC